MKVNFRGEVIQSTSPENQAMKYWHFKLEVLCSNYSQLWSSLPTSGGHRNYVGICYRRIFFRLPSNTDQMIKVKLATVNSCCRRPCVDLWRRKSRCNKPYYPTYPLYKHNTDFQVVSHWTSSVLVGRRPLEK